MPTTISCIVAFKTSTVSDAAAKKLVFRASLKLDSEDEPTAAEDERAVAFREQRTSIFLEGLRGVFFGEQEAVVLPIRESDLPPRGSVPEALQKEIDDLLMQRERRLRNAIDVELRRRPRATI